MLHFPALFVISVKLLAQNMSLVKGFVMMPWRIILAGQNRLGGLFILWPALKDGCGQDDESEGEFIHFFPKKKKEESFILFCD